MIAWRDVRGRPRCAARCPAAAAAARRDVLGATRLAWAETLTAATRARRRRGSAPRSSAGPPRAPGRPAPSPARGRGPARRAASSALSIARAVSGRDLGARRGRRRARSSGSAGQQDAAHRGRVGREAGADVDRDAHDRGSWGRGRRRRSRRRRARDTERRLAHLGGEPLEVRLGDLGQRQAGQVRVAELEHARREREVLAVGAHVAEVGQREQEAAGGGAGEAGAAGDVGQRQLGVVGAEGADHRQPALERLDEVLTPRSFTPSVFWAIATALLAAGTPA